MRTSLPRPIDLMSAIRSPFLVLPISIVCAGLTVAAAASDDASAGACVSWPDFRGPWHNGIATASDDAEPVGVPIGWGEAENVAWKTAIPHQGWSTPVVLDGQIWLTTATADGHEFHVLCVDAATGEIRFSEKLFHADNPEPLGNNVNSYASPSPVVEPGRVYVHFGSYGTACLDTATTQVLWKREDLPCRHYRGPGSSPFLHEDLLVLSFDGADVQYLAALDKRSGETVWRTDRTTAWQDLDENGMPKREGDFRKAFGTPIAFDAGGRPQLFSIGSTSAFAYEPKTGHEIWRVHFPAYSPASRAVFGNGLLYFSTGRGDAELLAVRVDGRGDVTDSHIAWKVSGNIVPQEPSPLLVDGLFYMVSNAGVVTCLDAATGSEVWSERIGGNHMASPIYADGRLYFFSVQGKTVVLKAGRTCEVVATNELDSGFMASPAVVGKTLFLRTKTHLYRVEQGSS